MAYILREQNFLFVIYGKQWYCHVDFHQLIASNKTNTKSVRLIKISLAWQGGCKVRWILSTFAAAHRENSKGKEGAGGGGGGICWYDYAVFTAWNWKGKQ